MTDEEVKELLIKLACQRVAAWQRGQMAYRAPDDGPEVRGDIKAIVWYVGVRQVRASLATHGATVEQIAGAVAALKQDLDIIEAEDLVQIPNDLAREFAEDLRGVLALEPEEILQRLDEKLVDFITDARVEIYLNESQHRGRPHVAVVLQDGKVSVSLDDPPVLLTPHGYRGEASALKVVKKHLPALRKLWDDTRPDDQKLTKQ